MADPIPKTPRIKLSQQKYKELCQYILERDKWCVFCGEPFSATPAHIKRRSQGGDDSPRNMVRACIPCHQAFDKYEMELPEKTKTMLENEPLFLPDRRAIDKYRQPR